MRRDSVETRYWRRPVFAVGACAAMFALIVGCSAPQSVTQPNQSAAASGPGAGEDGLTAFDVSKPQPVDAANGSFQGDCEDRARIHDNLHNVCLEWSNESPIFGAPRDLNSGGEVFRNPDWQNLSDNENQRPSSFGWRTWAQASSRRMGQADAGWAFEVAIPEEGDQVAGHATQSSEDSITGAECTPAKYVGCYYSREHVKTGNGDDQLLVRYKLANAPLSVVVDNKTGNDAQREPMIDANGLLGSNLGTSGNVMNIAPDSDATYGFYRRVDGQGVSLSVKYKFDDQEDSSVTHSVTVNIELDPTNPGWGVNDRGVNKGGSFCVDDPSQGTRSQGTRTARCDLLWNGVGNWIQGATATVVLRQP